MKNTLLFFLLILGSGTCFAQNKSWFQLFKPGLSVEALYMGGNIVSKDNTLDQWQLKADLVVPIKSKFGLKVDWLEMTRRILEIRKLEDVSNLAYAIQPKAHQIFWTFQANHRQFSYSSKSGESPLFDRDPLFLYGANTGISGIHYLKKRYFLFYAGIVGFSEDPRSFEQIQPQFSGAIGAGRLLNLKSMLFWGAYAHYANGQIYPLPFFGAEVGLLNDVRFSMLLPSYLKLYIDTPKKLGFTLLSAVNSYTSGFTNASEALPFNGSEMRYGLAFLQLRNGAQLRVKVSKQFRMELEGGYSAPLVLSFLESGKELDRVQPLPGPYFRLGLHKNFGKSLLDSSMGNLLGF